MSIRSRFIVSALLLFITFTESAYSSEAKILFNNRLATATHITMSYWICTYPPYHGPICGTPHFSWSHSINKNTSVAFSDDIGRYGSPYIKPYEIDFTQSNRTYHCHVGNITQDPWYVSAGDTLSIIIYPNHIVGGSLTVQCQ